MKKVGIMTLYYKTYNYGAQLQAYALQKAVQKLGYECEQICYKWYNADIEYFYTNQSGNIDRFRDFAFSIPHSKRVYSPETIHEATSEYDIFICGSDQIWGVTASMPPYVVPHMSLSFVPDDKIKFSYGASMGGAALTTNQIPPIEYWASRLDALSVREQGAVPFIAGLTGKDVTSVLDPTLLLKTSEWSDIVIPPENKGEYIFTYNIGGNTELYKSAKELSQKLGCPIKTVSYNRNDTAGPKEFLGLINNAKYVLTNSFHGTVFSIVFGKQFYVFPVDNIQSEFSKNMRITDLLSKLGQINRFILKADDIDFSTAIGYEQVNEQLRKDREMSIAFLFKSLLIEKLLPTIDEASIKMSDISIPNCECELNTNLIKRSYHAEIKRNSIYVKLLKYQIYGCLLDHEPFFAGKVIIYGAGKIGRLAAECSENKVLCFVDGSDKIKSAAGLPVFNIDSDKLKALIAEAGEITFAITPVWDFEDIYQNIKLRFPMANIISIEKVVEKLWE